MQNNETNFFTTLNDAMRTSHRKRFSTRRLSFSSDVLTGESEHRTLFPSVPLCKQPKYVRNNSTYLQPPAVWYAISGLGDGLAWFFADQRLKLAEIFWIRAGSSALHAVTSEEEEMGEWATTTLGRHRNFNIRTCQVPKSLQKFPDVFKTLPMQPVQSLQSTLCKSA